MTSIRSLRSLAAISTAFLVSGCDESLLPTEIAAPVAAASEIAFSVSASTPVSQTAMPVTAVNDDAVGTAPWIISSLQGNVSAFTVFTTTAGEVTQYLRATNFGFAIPLGARIVGIRVDVERHQNAGFLGVATVSDNSVRLGAGMFTNKLFIYDVKADPRQPKLIRTVSLDPRGTAVRIRCMRCPAV